MTKQAHKNRSTIRLSDVTRRDFLRYTGSGIGIAAVPFFNSDAAAASVKAGKPKSGGTLTVGMSGGQTTETLNPNYATTTIELARATQLFDTLLAHDPEFRRVNALAESVEPNNDATEWTIRLKDGVEFHNGKSLEAKDVVYTLKEWIFGKEHPGAGASHFSTLDLENIVVKDKRTLTLPFVKPFSPLPDVLAVAASNCLRIVPEGFDLNTPVGTGAFKFKSFTPGQQSTFVKNPNYWQEGKPYFDSVVITDINDDTARVNALMGGQVDAINNVPGSNIRVLNSNPNVTVLNSKTGSFNPFTMRTDKEPFNDVRVRQAFRLIAGRQQIIDNAFGGQGTVANDLYAPFDPAFDSDIPQRKQDLEKAKALLKEAGQENLSVTLMTSNISAGTVDMCLVFSQQAKAAGVTVNVKEVQPTQFWADHFLKSEFSVSNWATRSYLIQAADSMLPNAAYNEQHWENEKWAKIVHEAFATVDEKKRTELIHEAQRIEWEEGGYIVYGYYDVIDAYSSNLNGFVKDRSGLSLTTFGFANVWRQ